MSNAPVAQVASLERRHLHESNQRKELEASKLQVTKTEPGRKIYEKTYENDVNII